MRISIGRKRVLWQDLVVAVLLAICASAIFGVADFLGGMSARRISPILTAATTQIVGLGLLLTALAVFPGELIGEDLWLGVIAGTFGTVALTAFYFALAQGAMSVVAPVSAVTAAIVPVIFGMFIGEVPRAIHWIGIALALVAIVLISREGTTTSEPDESPPLEETATRSGNRVGILAGLGAGVGFGLYISIITRTSEASGIWPAVTARTAGAVILVLVVLGMRISLRGLSRTGLRFAVAGGLLDASSNILILEAGRRGMLAVVGVIGALFPASTILLARFVLHERLQRHQIAGLAVAVAAIALIAFP